MGELERRIGGASKKGIKLLSTSAVNTTCVQSTSLTTKGSVMQQTMDLAMLYAQTEGEKPLEQI